MSNYKVNANQLTPGKFVQIRGKLTFSRVASKIEGDELAKMNERKRVNGRKDITDKPHTTATVSNAHIVPQTAGSLTLEEQFIEERMGLSTKNPASGNFYTAVNKGNSLPKVGFMETAAKFVEVDIERELQNGLDVTLVIRTFKGSPNNGTALDGVIVNEPIRYYEPANLGLEQRGIEAVFLAGGHDVEAPVPVKAPAPVPPTQTPYSANPSVGYNPAAQQAPQAPAPMPSHQPYNPAAQPYTPPVQPYAPAPYAPAPENQGYAGMPVPQAPGIRYDGQDRPY